MLDMNMRGFLSLVAEKEKPVSAETIYGRHKPSPPSLDGALGKV
jgi:hypothetical protein